MNNETFITLHRHWMWANVMKQHFDRELEKGVKLPFNIADRPGAYMLLWYSVLFSVLETFRNAGVTFPTVQKEIDEIYEPLKDLRNAIFHPQPKYWPRKLLRFISMKDTPIKVREIHSFIGGYFLQEIARRKASGGASWVK